MAIRRPAVLKYLAGAAALLPLVPILQLLRPALNQTVIALVFVLLVISMAAWAGRGPALSTAVLAGLAFNFFFIEPYNTLRIHRPEDVVAFLVFIFTAVIVGHLSSRLRQTVVHTEVQQQQIEQIAGDFKRASVRAAQADSFQKSEQLKTALLDAVTHDLRTPLTSIKAAISTVRGAEIPSEGRDELFEVIEQEADRLNRFIQGMMDLAQLEAGRLRLDSRPVSAEEIIEDAIVRAEPLLNRRAVEVNVDSNLPPLNVDPRLISQVLFALAENAAKYSDHGSRISIAAQCDGELAHFTVTDEGPGIAPELRNQLFQKFARAGQGSGFGLGLAIARGIVQAHSGRIWVSGGTNGVGTSVHFQIPLAVENGQS
ncbi:MAG: DUF4118 domain-containing protein [Acidobacteriales bacterium]|nr:DUF4118 domain-containing protein [Terriglobales bacterium]